MARVFISGSSTGLGLMAGQLLVEQGHQVVLHARNRGRAEAARASLSEVENVVIGDLSTIVPAISAEIERRRGGASAGS